jgi:cobalt-zinc-cadmium efflux system outer membrane protein
MSAPLAPSPDGVVARGLTLADFEQLALAHNPTLVAAQMGIRASQGDYVQAGLWPNPVLGWQAEEMGDQGTAGQQGMFLEQQVITGGKLRLSQSVAAHEIRQARHTWEAQRLRVLNDIRAAFYDALLAEQAVALSRQLARTSEEMLATAQKLEAALETSRIDVLQVEIDVETERLNLNNSLAMYDRAWRRLVAAAGTPDFAPAPLTGSAEDAIPQWTWEESLQRLLTTSPEIAGARAGVESARCRLARAQAERVPNFDVAAAARYDIGGDQMLASVAVGVPAPLWNRNQGNIARASAELIAAEKEVRRVELDLYDRLSVAFRTYQSAQQQVVAFRERILPKSRQTRDLVRSGYERGEFDYLAVLTTERTYSRLRVQYLNALQRLRAASINIEGLLLRGSLVEGAEDLVTQETVSVPVLTTHGDLGVNPP